MMSIRWCGAAARSAAVGLAVPMSRSRYTCAESTLMISTGKRAASSSATAVLPLAVGPISKIAGGNLVGEERVMRPAIDAAEGARSCSVASCATRLVGLQMAVRCREQARVGAGSARVPQHVAYDVIGLDAPAGFQVAQHGCRKRRTACKQHALGPLQGFGARRVAGRARRRDAGGQR